MKKTSMPILLVLLIIISATIYFMFKGSDEQKDKTIKQSTSLFPGYESKDVTKLKLDKQAQHIEVSLIDGEWKVTSDKNSPADTKLVKEAIDKVKKFKVKDILSTNPKKQTTFEVDKETGLLVSLYDSSDNPLASFYVGKNGPYYNSTFLRKEGSNEVILINENLRALFTPWNGKWVDRTIFNFEPDTIEKFSLITDKSTISFEKDNGGQWIGVEPEPFTPKEVEIKRMTRAFSSLKTNEYAKPEDVDNESFSNPAITVKAVLNNGEEKILTIAVHDEEKKQYFAQTNTSDFTYLIVEYRVNMFKKDFDMLKEVSEEKTIEQAIQEVKSEKKAQEKIIQDIEKQLNKDEADNESSAVESQETKEPKMEKDTTESTEPQTQIIDNDSLPEVIIKTDKGDIVLELYEDDAPNTVANFINLIQSGYYNGLKFHRVIDNFMIQTGDPQGTGAGGPGYTFKDEFSSRKHQKGTLSMANRGPNTNGSQFFITHIPTSWLDGKHTVFGQVLKGQDVVDTIKQGDKMNKVIITKKRGHEYVPEVTR